MLDLYSSSFATICSWGSTIFLTCLLKWWKHPTNAAFVIEPFSVIAIATSPWHQSASKNGSNFVEQGSNLWVSVNDRRNFYDNNSVDKRKRQHFFAGRKFRHNAHYIFTCIYITFALEPVFDPSIAQNIIVIQSGQKKYEKHLYCTRWVSKFILWNLVHERDNAVRLYLWSMMVDVVWVSA